MYNVTVNVTLNNKKTTNFSFLIEKYNIYDSIPREILIEEISKKVNFGDVDSFWFNVTSI